MVRLGWMLALLPLATARAAVLEVGPGAPYPSPSAAISAARDGDTVRVAAGTYEDCATIRRNRLTLEAAGGPVVLRGKTCAGKGILVIAGSGVTIRGLTLEGARVPDGNGAGIRAEGGDLLVERTRFIANENGLLSAGGPMTILIRDSDFIGNGTCRQACAHGIYAGHIALLRVERSRFSGQREGHHIKSRAARTEILDNDIDDGPDGTASYLIDLPNGGAADIMGNRLRKGPRAANPVAIAIGEEGSTASPSPEAVRISGNVYRGDMGGTTVFVRNLSPVPADLSENRFSGPVTALSGAGSVRP